jgi:hypothetical protein
MNEKWQEVKRIWKTFPWLWFAPGLLLGLIIGFVLGIGTGSSLEGWFADGFWPELLGIGITVSIIDVLYRRNEKRQLKKQLIREMSSSDNGIARRAIVELDLNGWLRDGSLQKTGFYGANWQGADLSCADLRECVIGWCNLRKVDFGGATLNKTSFEESDLCNARGLDAAFFDQIQVPDGNWHNRQVDFSRFTDSKHPAFWRSTDEESPAYHKNE